MRKSNRTGQLVVFISGSQILSISSEPGTRMNSSTSPSLLLGTKSFGSSISKTNSVWGKIPLSDWKKKLPKARDYDDSNEWHDVIPDTAGWLNLFGNFGR